MIQDSGERREFESGAVRDIQEGKGRCDLLPLDILGDHINNDVFYHIDRYVREGNPAELHAALEEFIGDDREDWCEAMLEVSRHYEDGCVKYGERNWEQGIPLHCYIDSAVRHYLKHMRGDKDERHDRAFVWNLLGALWTNKHKPELVDLPFANKGESI